MRWSALSSQLSALGLFVAAAAIAGGGEPVLYKKVEIPGALLQKMRTRGGEEIFFGGDIRVGDLNNDGQADLLVFRSVDGGMKPGFLGAFTLEGEVLWTAGEAGEQPNRPGPVAIYDIDGDGETEVVSLFVDGEERRHWQSLENIVFQVRDGATGRLEREARVPEVRSHGQPGPPRKKATSWNDPNWVHIRILVANFRGLDTPRDFVIKLGQKLFALSDELELLWVYEIPSPWQKYGTHTAYIPAVGDIDGDGRDEVTGGYYLVDEDGTALWEKKLGPHMDSVAITAWDGGKIRAVCSGGGHILDEEGRIVLALGEDVVPHGQEVRVADFDGASPGREMILRYKGHTTGVMVVSEGGEILRRFELNEAPNNTGMEAVYWSGHEEPALLANGGVLWSGAGESMDLPGLELPARNPIGKNECPGSRMPWYHTIPGDFCGDGREEVLLYNPWDTAVYIFTPKPLRRGAYGGYRPGARQYNARLMD